MSSYTPHRNAIELLGAISQKFAPPWAPNQQGQVGAGAINKQRSELLPLPPRLAMLVLLELEVLVPVDLNGTAPLALVSLGW